MIVRATTGPAMTVPVMIARVMTGPAMTATAGGIATRTATDAVRARRASRYGDDQRSEGRDTAPATAGEPEAPAASAPEGTVLRSQDGTSATRRPSCRPQPRPRPLPRRTQSPGVRAARAVVRVKKGKLHPKGPPRSRLVTGSWLALGLPSLHMKRRHNRKGAS